MATVSLDQLQDAVEWVSTDMLDNEAYVCRQSGKIYWISGDPGMLDEEEETPEDIHDSDKYVFVPDKRGLDLGNRLAFDFAERYLPQHYEKVRKMFRQRGAYRRFRGLLEQQKMRENWYHFSDEQTAKALAEWCESMGLTLET